MTTLSPTGRAPVTSDGSLTVWPLMTKLVEPPPSRFIASTAPSERISHHVSAILRKLGARNRSEAAARAAELRLPGSQAP
jgi:hypothetical protein